MATIRELEAQIGELGVKATEYRRGMLEGGDGYNPYEAQMDALEAELIALRKAERDAEWTREVTVARRAEWNEFVRSVNTAKGVPADKVRERIAAQGWSLIDLKDAVARHGL